MKIRSSDTEEKFNIGDAYPLYFNYFDYSERPERIGLRMENGPRCFSLWNSMRLSRSRWFYTGDWSYNLLAHNV